MNGKRRLWRSAAAGLGACAALVACAALGRGPVRIAADGRPGCVIFHDPAAPESVKTAAEELRRAIRLSTAADVPVRTEPSSPMICLGDNAASRQAGLSAATLPEETFRIVTRGRDLYIVGKDTPDGRRTAGGGFSRGTQFGVYAFLEKELGVRWLMPGPLGEVIPRRQTLAVADLDITQGPAFGFRQLNVVNRNAEVVQWLTRHKVSGFSTPANTACARLIQDTHSWAWYVTPDMLKARPDFMAARGDADKFCTSNPDLATVFAEGLLRWVGERPEYRCASMSPSDGGGFCECDRCRGLTEKDPHGKTSYTPVILRFYANVARLVSAKRPDLLLCGYVYYNYAYPPREPVALPPNVHLSLYPLNYYGFGLHKPLYRQEFEDVLRRWAVVAGDIGYGNYSTWLRSESGAPYGPGLDILRLEIPAVKRHGFNSVGMAGSSAWGYAAVNNYIVAKQLWDPSVDVEAVFREWLTLAYGDGWQAMERLYRLLDDALRDYKVAREPVEYRGSNYEMTHDVIRHVLLPRLAEIEAIYIEAMNGARAEAEKRRLGMFGDNMAVFHANLRRAGLIEQPERSVFYRSDEDFDRFLAANAGSLALYSDRKGKTVVAPIFSPEERLLRIPRLARGRGAPVIDGEACPGEWEGAAVADRFRKVGSRTPAVQATTVRALYDDARLYLLFECAEPGMKDVKADAVPRDAGRQFFGTDTVEVFLDPDEHPRGGWHLGVNAGGSIWDGVGSDSTPNPEWSSAVRRHADRWTVEMAVPFQAIKVQTPTSKRWRANLGRYATRAREASSWNSVEQGFLEPAHFGRFSFEPDGAAGDGPAPAQAPHLGGKTQ